MDLNTFERSAAFSSAVSAQEPSIRCNGGMCSRVPAFAQSDPCNFHQLREDGDMIFKVFLVLATYSPRAFRKVCEDASREFSGPFSTVLPFKRQLAFAVQQGMREDFVGDQQHGIFSTTMCRIVLVIQIATLSALPSKCCVQSWASKLPRS